MTSFEYHLLSCLEGRIPTILKKTVFSIGRWDLHLEAIRGSLLAKKLKKLESVGLADPVERLLSRDKRQPDAASRRSRF